MLRVVDKQTLTHRTIGAMLLNGDLKEAGPREGFVNMASLLGMALVGWMSGWVFDMPDSDHAAFLNGIV
jgi:hypothetical protein